jgi:biopolymer transport protein ExbB
MSGVLHYLQQGGGVILGVAILLLLMSVLTWCLALGKAWSLTVARRSAAPCTERFWQASTLAEGIDAMRSTDAEGLFAPLATAALTAFELPAPSRTASSTSSPAGLPTGLPEGLPTGLSVSTLSSSLSPHPRIPSQSSLTRADRVVQAVRRALMDAQRRLESGLTLLATIASVAPFVGLLGTVWGIYHALIGIAASGNPSITDVAGPVGEALIMTAFGLAVAIPAVVAYNLLGRQVRAVNDELDGFARDLHACLLESDDGIRSF